MYTVKIFLYFRVSFDDVFICGSVCLSHLKVAHHMCSVRMALCPVSRAMLCGKPGVCEAPEDDA
jgi:hypothetical protein